VTKEALTTRPGKFFSHINIFIILIIINIVNIININNNNKYNKNHNNTKEFVWGRG